MDERIRIYTRHTDELKDPEVFAACLKEVSTARRKKIDGIKSPQEKRLSLASALALDQGLRAIGLREKDMKYETGKHGKPFFLNEPAIHFSLSHSGELAVAAFSEKEIGCDIQKMKEFSSESRMSAIAKRFYTEKECAWIFSSEISLARKIRFYRLWVLKESYAKATGEGLGSALLKSGFLMEPSPFLEEKNRDFCQFAEYSFGEYRAAVCRLEEI